MEQNELKIKSINSYCETPKEASKSQIALSILEATFQDISEIIEIEKPSTEIVDIYKRFISNKPITYKEQRYLLSFFKNDEAKKIAQNYFSQLIFLQGNRNNSFFRSYLKDKNGKLDISNLIKYLYLELLKYNLVVSNSSNIKDLGEGYFSYEKNKKRGLVEVVNNSEKNNLLPEEFEDIIYNDGFITTVKKIEDGKYQYEVHIKNKGKLLLIHIFTGEKQKEYIVKKVSENYIDEKVPENFVEIRNDSGIFIYELNKDYVLEEIIGGTNIKSISFEKGGITKIEYQNGERGLYYFDNNLGALKCLIKYPQNTIVKSFINGDRIILLKGNNELLDIYYYSFGELFKFKKPFTGIKIDRIDSDKYYAKRLFGKNIFLSEKTVDMLEYLEPIDTPVR